MPSVSQSRLATLALAALVMIPASTAFADDRPRDADAVAPGKTAKFVISKDFGGVNAPNARLAGLFDAGGAPIRTKGVNSIERIDTGVYCIQPAPSANINVNSIIPAVSVEYFYSTKDEVTVQWVAKQSGCGSGRIGVYTFLNPNTNFGNYVFSNGVGFSIIVP
jgi:hypothetical protein